MGILKHGQQKLAAGCRDVVAFVIRFRTMAMPVMVMVMVAAGEQPGRHNVHREPQDGDRDGLGETD